MGRVQEYRSNRQSPIFMGFTLVEILVAAGILSVFLAGVFGLFGSGSKSFISGSWLALEQKSAQVFFSAWVEELEQATPQMIQINPNGTRTSSLDTPLYVNSLVYSPNGTAAKKKTIDFATWTCLMVFSVTRPYMAANATFSTLEVPGNWSGVSVWGMQRKIRYVRSNDPGAFPSTPVSFPGAIVGIPSPALVQSGGLFVPSGEHIRNRVVHESIEELSIMEKRSAKDTSIEILGKFIRYSNNVPTSTSFEQASVAKLASNTSIVTF